MPFFEYTGTFEKAKTETFPDTSIVKNGKFVEGKHHKNVIAHLLLDHPPL